MPAPHSLRLIALLPSATEIIAALGLTEQLVGRSHECDYPLEVQNLPVCTQAQLNSAQPSGQIDAEVKLLVQKALSIYQIKTDIIEELQPTHIITQDQCDVCAVSFADVQKAVAQLVSSQPQIVSLQPNLLADVWTDIERVALTLGVDAQPILAKLHSRIEACQQKTQALSQESLPTVATLEWIDPLMATGNWIPELVEIAGGKPLFGETGKRSPYLDWKELTKADPEFMIIMTCGFDLNRTRKESQVLTQHPGWPELQAVKNDNVYITDGNAYFNRPGPRLVDSLEILAEILHPKLFDDSYQGTGWERFQNSSKL